MKWAVILGGLALAGCQNGGIGMAESPAWFMTASQDQQMAYFGKRCAAYGFKPGTNEMAQCMMIESRSSRNQASANMASASQDIANARPKTVTTNCHRFGNNVSCTSY